MPPPSQLAIATSSLNRLVKEESSYRTELASQQKRVEKLQAGGGDDEDVGNLEFQLRQEVCVDTTVSIFISFPRNMLFVGLLPSFSLLFAMSIFTYVYIAREY